MLLAIAGALFVPVQIDNLWQREALNSGHTLLFAFLFFVIYDQIRVSVQSTKLLIVYLTVLIFGLLLGIVIEVLQSLSLREASLDDVTRDFFGLMAGLSLHAAFTIRSVSYRKVTAILLMTASIVFFLLGTFPLWKLSVAYMERAEAFPVVVDFDAAWPGSFLRYQDGRYPGVALIEPEPDWSAYNQLRLSVRSQNKQDIILTLRVHDKQHNLKYVDRFNTKLVVKPGSNTFLVSIKSINHGPAERLLNIKNIAGMTLFTHDLSEWEQLEVGNISLE